MEAQIASLKQQISNTEGTGISNDALQRKVTLLEEELDASEKNLKETVEKFVFNSFAVLELLINPPYYYSYHLLLGYDK